MLITAQKVR